MSDSNFDGVLDPDAGWPDIPQASTQFVVLGGQGGPLNEQATALAARTNKLKSDIGNISAAGFGGQYKNRTVNVSGNGYQGSITADCIVVESIDFKSKVLRNINVSFNGANAGPNGIDENSIIAGNWYRLFVIYNPITDAVASLISLSTTAPTLPNGYTHFCKVGTAYVAAATTNFKRARKTGNRVDLLQNPANTTSYDNVLLNGVTNPVITAFSCAACAPPEATHLIGISNPSINGYMYILPSSNPYDCGRTLAATDLAGMETQMMHPLFTPQTLYYTAGAGSSFRGVGYIED